MIYAVYFMSVIFLVFFGLHQYYRYNRIYYVNLSLNQFRELRHEVLLYLSSNVKGDKSNSHTEDLRKLYAVLDITISQLDKFKHIDIKMVGQFFITLIACSNQIKSVKKHDMKDATQFEKKYWAALSTSFRSIPLFKLRIILVLAKFLAEILLSIGIRKCKRFAIGIDTLVKVNNDVSNHCLG